MIRAASFALWLALLGLALTCIALLNDQHTAQNDGLPLVKSEASNVQAPMLFSPCPLTPQNFHKRITRDA